VMGVISAGYVQLFIQSHRTNHQSMNTLHKANKSNFEIDLHLVRIVVCKRKRQSRVQVLYSRITLVPRSATDHGKPGPGQLINIREVGMSR
jgi:hypothetical protein